MITLSNGHSFKYVAASGALNLDGKGWWHEKLFGRSKKIFDPSLFTVVTKTLTYGQKKGNYRSYWPFGCIRPIFQGGRMVGTVNAVGLTNPGIHYWCENIGPNVNKNEIPIIVSIQANEKPHLMRMVEWSEPFDIVGRELNESCPNVKEGIEENVNRIVEKCRFIYDNSDHPLILKLSVLHNVEEIIPQVKDYVEAISINSVPWKVIFSNRTSPLVHLGGGGVSGEVAQKYTWPFATEIADMGTIPVIVPSIWNYRDINFLRSQLQLTDAISFGSVFIRDFTRPTRFVRRDIKEMHRV